jgi:hypothetical protein
MEGAPNAVPAINSYSNYYTTMDWASLCVHLGQILQEFEVPTEGIINTTGQQLHEDVRQTCNEMPHTYVTMVNDDPCLVLLHHGTYHSTPIGSMPELWNNHILMFTGDVVGIQLPHAVIMPALLLVPVPRGVNVENLAQQLCFISL